ncbi:CinA family protein [Candidatus Saganbacteria bacterium]|nr:CinA family protein [Candidatus Saganbacteria bacterium]
MEEEVKPLEVKLEDFFSKLLNMVGKTTDLEISELLKKNHKTISVAESITGGLISARLTNLSGSSDYFIGGIVSYSNRIKIQELGIPAAIIAKEGPVSSQVAELMADGIRRRFKTNIGLAITGCAGPDPLPPAPVGLIYAAVAIGNQIEWKELRLQGSRAEIREKASQAALGLLWFALGGEI